MKNVKIILFLILVSNFGIIHSMSPEEYAERRLHSVIEDWDEIFDVEIIASDDQVVDSFFSDKIKDYSFFNSTVRIDTPKEKSRSHNEKYKLPFSYEMTKDFLNLASYIYFNPDSSIVDRLKDILSRKFTFSTKLNHFFGINQNLETISKLISFIRKMLQELTAKDLKKLFNTHSVSKEDIVN